MNVSVADAILSLGVTTLKSRPILATPKAAEHIRDHVSAFPTKKDGEKFDLGALLTEVELGENGKIANSRLIPQNALVVCLASEMPLDVNRWMFII